MYTTIKGHTSDEASNHHRLVSTGFSFPLRVSGVKLCGHVHKIKTSYIFVKVFDFAMIGSRELCHREQHRMRITNQPVLFPFLHQGPKGDVGISGEQGIPGPPVCREFNLFRHLAKLETQANIVLLYFHLI